ncbi:MAG: hypothetical protein MJY87_07260 [Fibrobacter sp.]|nr:hypothetical protein [Fibrobacter sp.]
MNEHFKNMIASATESKEQFDCSMENLKGALQDSVSSSAPIYSGVDTQKTGWLKGSLSYPWVLVCSIVPTLKELF